MICKKAFFVLVCLAALVAAGFAPTTSPAADNYSMTVKNDTKYLVQVAVSAKISGICTQVGNWEYIEPGNSHTWDTGTNCPGMVGGKIKGPQGWKMMLNATCLGQPSGNCGYCCESVVLSVCRWSGQGDEVDNGQFTFCK